MSCHFFVKRGESNLLGGLKWRGGGGAGVSSGQL